MSPEPPPTPPPAAPARADDQLTRAQRRAGIEQPAAGGVEAAPLDPNDPHAPAPGEVSEFIDDAKRFWAANGSWIATTLLIFAVIFGGYRFLQNRTSTAREQAWSDLYGVNSQNLVDLVAEAHPGAVRTLAQLRGGDLALAKHQKLADPETSPEAAELLTRAESRYQAALASAPHDIYRLNALDGLGVVAESRRDADAARKHYEALKQAAGDRFPAWTARTDRRLAMLNDLPAPVRFAPAPAAPLGDADGLPDLSTPSAPGAEVVPAAPDAAPATE